ncbi:drug/metabolite transporter (DMT)-like permease [Inhella inkyongensis]|uniref:Drug/metabolite transporter (DMT)-like permease n=1 Tax=Inhella inkyongensis TaxID=392593 RepID=A0A840S6Q4_9BURK|nr:DMT family transporter [Inhella inkyongensis]MBB5206125.1 drug/metabolite transporter (DMT)-like permease [Inhella inkyongensis]
MPPSSTSPLPQLSPNLVLWLTLPPLMWAGNAVVGRLLHEQIPATLLNSLRWGLALALLLPLAQALRRHPRQWWDLWWQQRRWLAATGVLGMGVYNALLYQALQSSGPINVTLIAASLPLGMLLMGLLVFGNRPRRTEGLGALLALAGVLVVLSQGQWQRLRGLQWVAGDLLMLFATLAWALYSWLLTRRPDALAERWNWADGLLGQILFGLPFALLCAAAEQHWAPATVRWSWPLALALLFIACGPSVLAYRCWALGVERAGPAVAAFFANLTPVFAGLLSGALMGDPPQLHHALAFALIAAGILVSSRR